MSAKKKKLATLPTKPVSRAKARKVTGGSITKKRDEMLRAITRNL